MAPMAARIYRKLGYFQFFFIYELKYCLMLALYLLSKVIKSIGILRRQNLAKKSNKRVSKYIFTSTIIMNT